MITSSARVLLVVGILAVVTFHQMPAAGHPLSDTSPGVHVNTPVPHADSHGDDGHASASIALACVGLAVTVSCALRRAGTLRSHRGVWLVPGTRPEIGGGPGRRLWPAPASLVPLRC